MLTGSRGFHHLLEQESIFFDTIFIPIGHRETQLAMASNETGVSKTAKIANFRPKNRYISETIDDRYTVTMEN